MECHFQIGIKYILEVCLFEINLWNFRSLPWVTDFAEKRNQLKRIKEEFEKFLLDQQLDSKVNFVAIKQRAEKDATDTDRLKLRDLIKRVVFPFAVNYMHSC